MSDVISDFFGDMDEEDSNKKIDTSIPEISSVRMEESRVDLTEAHYAEMAEEESRLEKYLAEPARMVGEGGFPIWALSCFLAPRKRWRGESGTEGGRSRVN